jgi:hypothetical protein
MTRSHFRETACNRLNLIEDTHTNTKQTISVRRRDTLHPDTWLNDTQNYKTKKNDNKTTGNRHLCRKATVLICHECLINTSVEKN